jgi:hypothetical protein
MAGTKTARRPSKGKTPPATDTGAGTPAASSAKPARKGGKGAKNKNKPRA